MALVGTCTELCPAAEAAQRRATGEVAACEGEVLVKRYTRPAAGLEPTPADVRTLPTLLRATAWCLGGGVAGNAALPLLARYEFVADRLRAVRQDAAVQGATSLPLLTALRAMLRFHAAAAYLFTGTQPVLDDAAAAAAAAGAPPRASAAAAFNAVLNDDRLADILDSGLAVAGRLARSSSGTPDGELAAMTDEFMAARILLAAPDPAACALVFRGMPAPLPPRSVAAYAIAAAWRAGNWHGAASRIAALPARGDDAALTLRCLAHRLLPTCRLGLLQEFAAALPSRRPALPLSFCVRVLCLGHSVMDGGGGGDHGSSSSSGSVGGSGSSSSDGGGGSGSGMAPWLHAARLARGLGARIILPAGALPPDAPPPLAAEFAAAPAPGGGDAELTPLAALRLQAALGPRNEHGHAAVGDALAVIFDAPTVPPSLRLAAVHTPEREDDAIAPNLWPNRILAALAVPV